MDEKKILHISKYYYPFRGGTEQIAQDCVSSLKGKYKQKVICFNHESRNVIDNVNGVEVIRCGCFAKIASQSLSIFYGKTLKRIFNTFKPDIVIFHYPNPFVAYYLLKYLPDYTKLLIYWHLDIVKQKRLKKLFNRQNEVLTKRADVIIATSPSYVEGSLHLNREKEKCVVVPNCINIERLQITEEIEENAANIRRKNQGKIICLAVGRHTEYKGFKYLIQASKFLDERFEIYIAGKGEETERLKKEAIGDNKIHFLGMIDDTELKAYMIAMDIFCFPSITKNEAFGIALAEGMYFGKPAVTFTIPGSGVNYVCLHGQNGIEVPNRDAKAYAEAMTKLADNPELRKQYGENGRKRVVANFLDSQFQENIKNIIDKI